MKKKIIINFDLLKELIAKHSVDTYLLGMAQFPEKAINATKFFGEIAQVADCPAEEFTAYVNAMSAETWKDKEVFERIPEIDVLFRKVQFPGIFQVIGQEALGKDPYIMHKDIKDVIKL